MTLGGLLLAAGAGRRFGGPKALALLDGEPLVVRGARVLLDAGCAPVVVVVGAQGAAVTRLLQGDPTLGGRCEAVENPDWETGLGSSLRVGLAALKDRCGAAAITLVDQPLLSPAAVRRVAELWHRGAAAAVATYGGEHGHPVVLDAVLWRAAAARAEGHRGARALLAAQPELIVRVPCDGLGSPRDVDSPQDLSALEDLGGLTPVSER